MSFENPSVNEIFEPRKEHIPEIGDQLEKETKAEIEVGGEKLNVDYRTLAIESLEKKDSDPVVVLPGFGSGWEGIAELGFSLACEGRKVILPSMPGYGNSDDPPEDYYKTDNFDNEAEVVNKLIDSLGLEEGKKVHLVGHSMGSEILATLAEKYPEKVSSLVLLNPAGVEEEQNKYAMGAKFVASGMKTSMTFAMRTGLTEMVDYEKPLYQHVPETVSPFTRERLAQRMSEAARLSEGHLLDKIKNTSCPVTYISGEMDSVFPPGDENDPNSQLARIVEAVDDETRIEKSVMAGLEHNTTLAPDEITAANIEHYLTRAEDKNKENEETPLETQDT